MANPATLYVTFREHTVPDPKATLKEGRPMFKTVELCDIRFSGDPLKKACFPAHEVEPNATRLAGKAGTPFEGFTAGIPVTYAMLYSAQYKAFKAHEAQPVNGTPLSEAPFLTESRRRELRALDVHTIEALAALDGQPLKQIGVKGREDKNAAQAYLDRAHGTADVTALAAENANLKAQLAAALAGTQAPPQPEPEPTGDEFDAKSDDELKVYISEATGSRPKGNPNRVTLLAAAREIAAVAMQQAA